MTTTLRALADDPWPVLWARRRAGAIGLALGLVLALFLCLVLPRCWQASMVVGPGGHGPGADLSALLPASESPTVQYLLQRVGSVTAADFSIYETLMTGPRIAAALQKDDALKGRLGALCASCATDPAILARWLDAHVRIRPVGATQMRRIALRLRDRELAADMLRALHRLTDETIRTDARQRTDQRIAYLRAQLGMVANPDHRDALIALLKEQERTRMMVGIDRDFAAEAIDPPSVDAHPVFPDPYLIMPVFALLGLVAGLGYGLLRE
ncbi:MAG: hypothetical protein H6865_01545 [Rhodospirillales bacterium]|nr:hypothetical protein [Alphaproteobacteria bacterium]MCB9986302.1 hypothetical protein [Rhodospirillales bacterium]USO07145.1 MAG: hypothetical protein H6866_06840 [Rhodospirillales bacterium]